MNSGERNLKLRVMRQMGNHTREKKAGMKAYIS